MYIGALESPSSGYDDNGSEDSLTAHDESGTTDIFAEEEDIGSKLVGLEEVYLDLTVNSKIFEC
jgi:hypothetical protein